MTRLVKLLATLSTAAVLGACGGGEVVVQASHGGGEGEPTPLPDLEVQLLPFDRDEVFDSLAQAFGQPEPQIPDTLLQLQEQIAAAQQEWQEAETEWNAARDRLKALSDTLAQLNRGEGRYRVLFQEFQDLEAAERQARQQSQQAFAAFEQLQAQFATQSQETQLLRQQWGDEAFADVDAVFSAKLEALDREIHVDTTNAQGVVRFNIPPGQWWVHARYELPYEELYWNVPIDVARGEPTAVELTAQTAERRPKL